MSEEKDNSSASFKNWWMFDEEAKDYDDCSLKLCDKLNGIRVNESVVNCHEMSSSDSDNSTSNLTSLIDYRCDFERFQFDAILLNQCSETKTRSSTENPNEASQNQIETRNDKCNTSDTSSWVVYSTPAKLYIDESLVKDYSENKEIQDNDNDSDCDIDRVSLMDDERNTRGGTIPFTFDFEVISTVPSEIDNYSMLWETLSDIKSTRSIYTEFPLRQPITSTNHIFNNNQSISSYRDVLLRNEAGKGQSSVSKDIPNKISVSSDKFALYDDCVPCHILEKLTVPTNLATIDESSDMSEGDTSDGEDDDILQFIIPGTKSSKIDNIKFYYRNDSNSIMFSDKYCKRRRRRTERYTKKK